VVPELITLADLITTPAASVQAVRTLRTLGVEPIAAEVNGPFIPDIHAAVATRATNDPARANTIAVVHRAGWRSASGVLRPADVEIWVAGPVAGEV
jgi:molecular chaperone GrpE (heat shock protein)